MFNFVIGSVLAAVLFMYVPANAGPRLLNPSMIALDNFRFDVKEGEPAVPPGLEGKAKWPGPGFMVIKFRGRDNSAERKKLSKSGIRFYDYIPVNAFLAKVPGCSVSELEDDAAIEFIGPYRPAYRLEKKLLEMVEGGAKGEVKLVVQAFSDEELAPIEKEVEALGGRWQVISDTPGLNGKLLKMQVDASKIAALASIDGVQRVEEEKTPELH